MWWGGGSFRQCMEKYEARESLEKGKYLANSYTVACRLKRCYIAAQFDTLSQLE